MLKPSKTRNLFVLHSDDHAELMKVLGLLQFKGCITTDGSISENTITQIYKNNKSLICIRIDSELASKYHAIHVYCCSDNISENVSIHHGDLNLNKDIIKQFEAIAAVNGANIGDHISNSSGSKNAAPSTSDCAYCNLLEAHRLRKEGVNVHTSDDPELNEPIIYRSEHFFAITTLGQFTYPYLLLIPYEHIVSIAVMNPELKQEFLQAIEDCSKILTTTFGCKKILVFENGTGNGGIGKAKDSVVHAHVHLVGTELTADDILEDLSVPLKKITFDELKNYGEHSYLLVREKGDDWIINDNPEVFIPRQYVRMLIARVMKLPEGRFNWRHFPYRGKRFVTACKIQRKLRQHWPEFDYEFQKKVHSFVFYTRLHRH